MRCGVLRVAVRRVLVLVSAIALVPAALLLIGSSVTRHRYQVPLPTTSTSLASTTYIAWTLG